MAPNFALPLLAGAASAIGNTRRVQLKRGWTEPAIVWAAIVGDSGTLKSPALEGALLPVRERQREAMREHAEAMKQFRVELAHHERELAAWKKSKSGDDPPERPEPPIADRCWTDDATTEALAVLLVNQWRGLLMVRDELAGWINGFDRYAAGKGGDAAKWLEMFGGRPMIVDRKTSGTIYVPAAAVSIAGGIQPDTLRRALGHEHRKNGLAARLLLSWPPRKPKRWTEADIDPMEQAAVAVLFDRLYALEPAEDEHGEPRPVLVTLTPEGKAAWIEFYNAHADEQADLAGDLSAAWSKLEGYAARLALVVHFVLAASWPDARRAWWSWSRRPRPYSPRSAAGRSWRSETGRKSAYRGTDRCVSGQQNSPRAKTAIFHRVALRRNNATSSGLTALTILKSCLLMKYLTPDADHAEAALNKGIRMASSPNRAGRRVTQAAGYRAFIPEPLPPDPPIRMDAELTKLLSDADRALGRLDGVASILPNPDLFVTMYVRQEAVLSSQIEGTQSTLEDVLEYEAELKTADQPRDVEEVLNYVRAVNHGLHQLSELPLSLRLIREVHEKLLTGVRGEHRNPGEFRTTQNWLGPKGCTIRDADFIPPPPQEMQTALGRFEAFLHDRDSLPMLIHCGLAHAQFETIHPFLDGNGRVGRLLITLLLCERKILSRPLLYLSHYLRAHRAQYYDRLTAIRHDGDWEGWIRFFLRGVFEVSQAAVETARAIMELRERHRGGVAKLPGNAAELLDFLFENPIVSIRRVERHLGCAYVTASNLIKGFEELGILSEVTGQKRNRRYIYGPYLRLFDRFALAESTTNIQEAPSATGPSRPAAS